MTERLNTAYNIDRNTERLIARRAQQAIKVRDEARAAKARAHQTDDLEAYVRTSRNEAVATARLGVLYDLFVDLAGQTLDPDLLNTLADEDIE